VRGADLALRDRGEGLPLVWGHGLLSSMDQEQAVGLFDWSQPGGGVRVIRYDARGHGRSEVSLDPADYRWPALAQDMLGVLSALGLDRAVLGGVSMGCATALHAAVAAPARATALLLVAPPTAWGSRPRQALVYRFGAGLVDWLGTAPFRLLSRLPRPGAGASILAPLQDVLLRELAAADPRAVAATLRGASQSDLPPAQALRALAQPALVLAWRGDPVHPLSSAERLAELLPRAELHVARSLAEVRAWRDRVGVFLEGVRGRG
jgi:pimeloyl-ACP methyl ester carboxylesterase